LLCFLHITARNCFCGSIKLKVFDRNLDALSRQRLQLIEPIQIHILSAVYAMRAVCTVYIHVIKGSCVDRCIAKAAVNHSLAIGLSVTRCLRSDKSVFDEKSSNMHIYTFMYD
jgi:hypothetical protein